MDNIQMLEDKITRIIEKIKTLSNEKSSLAAKVEELNAALKSSKEEISVLKKELEQSGALRAEIDQLNSERDAVRSQLENLIKELESVEM